VSKPAAQPNPVPEEKRQVVERLFRAMQTGAGAETDMMNLFADDAVFIEPFSGRLQTHRGADAIRAAFKQQSQNPPPEMRLQLDRAEIQGETVVATWTCTSPVFPAPMRGTDLVTIRPDGKIARLEIRLDDSGPQSAHGAQP
jgi:uncharacterized protein (TIGR02246 family)